jgi:elongator complex protein 3
LGVDNGGLSELAEAIAGTDDDPEALKKEFSKRYGWGALPLNSAIIANAPGPIRDDVARILRKKPSRTLSGVAPVAVMTSPAPCPHGTCDFCPGGVVNNTPQSYTGREPAAMRANDHGYEPGAQVLARLTQYTAGGHPTDKVDLIIMGGTFTARPRTYQEGFVKGCLDALNGHVSRDLRAAQDANVGADNRCVGLTLETRPDIFKADEVEAAVELGATRIELGVQNLHDDILNDVGRGHTVADPIEATREAKDAGLKVLYQMMPGLPGATPESDLDDFRSLFEDDRFMPDMLKIYPTLVIGGTRLHEKWLAGEYHPLEDAGAVTLIAEMKALIPPWVRIQRVQRDIPAPLIEAGVRKGNLREIVQERMATDGISCECIRCREVGRVEAPGEMAGYGLMRREYDASGGREVFLSFESDPSIASYLRLRMASGEARVRELKVLGEMVPLGRTAPGWQHRGMGSALLEEAEGIAVSEGCGRIMVTSGVGVRDYYSSKGYHLDGMYMSKNL